MALEQLQLQSTRNHKIWRGKGSLERIFLINLSTSGPKIHRYLYYVTMRLKVLWGVVETLVSCLASIDFFLDYLCSQSLQNGIRQIADSESKFSSRPSSTLCQSDQHSINKNVTNDFNSLLKSAQRKAKKTICVDF